MNPNLNKQTDNNEQALPSSGVKESFSICEAIANPKSYALLSKVIKDGILQAEPEAAQSLLLALEGLRSQSQNDAEAIEILRSSLSSTTLQQKTESSFNEDERKRISRRATQIIDAFGPDEAPSSYLDIGCGNGLVTNALAQAWNIPKEQAFGAEVYSRFGGDQLFTHLMLDSNEIALPDSSIEAVTALMVFHHEENPEALLRELGRVLQSGGRLFLRDHDSATPEHRMFCLALDTLYYTVFNDHSKIPVPGNYQSMQTWLAIAEDAGFILLSSTFPEPDNPNRPFHAMFTKV